MLIWLSRQSTSLVRTRSPVRIRLSAPKTHSRFVGAFCFIPALLHKNGSLCILDNILHSMLYCDSKANVNGRRLERPSRGGVAMDEVSVLYLIVILYLIKEIIRIGNKKR